MKLLVVILCFCTSVYAQEKDAELPFAIADEKKLDDDELKEKKEGWFITGLPQVSSDPVNGFGIGGDGYLYLNGNKHDPFLPYRTKFEAHLFATNKSQQELALAVDVPYLFDSKWRLRGEATIEDNPNLLYFGQTARTMNALSFGGKTYPTYTGYENAIGADPLFNTYRKREAILNISAERSMMDSKVRLVGGFEVAKVDVSTVGSGASLLAQEKNSQGVLGVGDNLVTILQLGIVYDTRDLEPDPSRGLFIELTEELSSSVIGSSFDFAKTFLHAKYFVPVLPSVFNHLVFAARGALGSTAGQAPFFEYQDGWSTEGSIEGLGGLRTLRGFKQNRFLARWMGYLNFEARYRLFEGDLWNQHFAVMAVPFFDLGRVWDKFSDLGLSGFRANGGGALRIAWNQSTILMFDYAMSNEDRQFFFNFGHIF